MAKYDIVVWGATGFTGQLVSEYLAKQYTHSELDWAIAGRNPEKLETLRNTLARIDNGWKSLPILTGDAFDRDSLDAITEQTNVVCTTVGPYAVYGTELVESCVENGTHYCDLTGEIHWVQKMIDTYHDDALNAGARIVHCCGFDSIPSDIGALMVQDYAKSNYDAYCSEIRAFVTSESGNFSGGTAASMVKTFEAMSDDPDIREAVMNPYALAPENDREGPDSGMQWGPGYDSDHGTWTGPFIMAATNEKVVRRTNALLNYSWGKNFKYAESLPTGSGIGGALKATGVSAGMAGMSGAMSISPLRSLMERYVLPDPGEGPDKKTRERGSFEVRLYGKGTPKKSENEFEIEGRVTAERDPGYGATAWMLSESAMCLARDEINSPLNGGILTPASGIGLPLINRLEQTEMDFSVGSKK